MRGENLLDQGRAGARHADDEDRRRRAKPLTAEAVEQLGREDGGDLGKEFLGHVRAVGRDRPLHSVAFIQVAERRRRIAEVEVGLAEREMQWHTRGVRFRAVGREQRLHRRDRRIVGSEFHQLCAPAQRGRRRRVDRQRLVERRPRLVLAAEGLHRAGALGEARVAPRTRQGGGPIESGHPFRISALA